MARNDACLKIIISTSTLNNNNFRPFHNAHWHSTGDTANNATAFITSSAFLTAHLGPPELPSLARSWQHHQHTADISASTSPYHSSCSSHSLYFRWQHTTWFVVSTQDLYRGDQMSDEAETWLQNGSSHDLADPVQVWENTHLRQRLQASSSSPPCPSEGMERPPLKWSKIQRRMAQGASS